MTRPKVYIRDIGLLHAILGIPFTRTALLGHPKAGASFESFCIEQILLHARLADPGAEGFFFRTHTGQEVDLIPTRIYGGGVDNQQGWQYDVARDGRFLINSVVDSVASPITLIQNWAPQP